MEITRNDHMRLQEMCDCYLETDYLPEMEKTASRPVTDPEEEALRYLALALLHTISEKAGKLSFKRKKGELRVVVENQEKETLPAPPGELFDRIIALMRRILHLEEARGEMPLVLGLRTGQLELLVSIRQDEEKESLKFRLPPL